MRLSLSLFFAHDSFIPTNKEDSPVAGRSERRGLLKV
jgi:hypothetical protein